jgi:hypothetical protein
MSKIEVDAIEPQSGTTLTIGASGDTITIPSGATLTNNGTATGFGKVLQVVSTTKTDTFSGSVTATTVAEPTGYSVSITPSSASNKILVMANFNSGVQTGAVINAVLIRSSTNIFIGDAAGTRERRTVHRDSTSTSDARNATIVFLDSPNTTSAITYSVGIGSDQSNTIYLNRSHDDTNATFQNRSASSITVMEIAG